MLWVLGVMVLVHDLILTCSIRDWIWTCSVITVITVIISVLQIMLLHFFTKNLSKFLWFLEECYISGIKYFVTLSLWLLARFWVLVFYLWVSVLAIYEGFLLHRNCLPDTAPSSQQSYASIHWALYLGI